MNLLRLNFPHSHSPSLLVGVGCKEHSLEVEISLNCYILNAYPGNNVEV